MPVLTGRFLLNPRLRPRIGVSSIFAWDNNNNNIFCLNFRQRDRGKIPLDKGL